MNEHERLPDGCNFLKLHLDNLFDYEFHRDLGGWEDNRINVIDITRFYSIPTPTLRKILNSIDINKTIFMTHGDYIKNQILDLLNVPKPITYMSYHTFDGREYPIFIDGYSFDFYKTKRSYWRHHEN